MNNEPDFQEEAKSLYDLLKDCADLLPQDSSLLEDPGYEGFALNVLKIGLEGIYYKGCNDQGNNELSRLPSYLSIRS